MDLEVSREERDEIVRAIQDEKSPVGIDAKETHVIIIQKLCAIERRLSRLERERGT
jgi:hypothetical protein